MKKKTIALIVCLTLIIGCAVGGTIAWLTDKTDPVVNTFTAGDVDITLAESENLNLKMVPGNTITKDPKVTVAANSEACWLFVKVDKSANLDSFISYTIADGWTPGEGTGEGKNGVPVGVYFREVAASGTNQTFSVLAGDTVTVKTDVTKAMLDGLSVEGATQPTLTFTAYACQKDNVTTAADAWAKVQP